MPYFLIFHLLLCLSASDSLYIEIFLVTFQLALINIASTVVFDCHDILNFLALSGV
jgi:hypothetical protein